MTSKLTIDDLYSLEDYSRLRPEFRARVMAHKSHRKVELGPHLTLLFEDRLTMHYQIQEMLRVEKIFEQDGIQEELDAYNPLIPDGLNWKATMLIEYTNADERRVALADLSGIEDTVWVRADDGDPVYAIADEDMERSNEQKTSSVHFLRFELTDAMVSALKAGASLELGTSHPHYTYSENQIPDATRESLIADLD